MFWLVYLGTWIYIARKYVHEYDGWLTQVVQTGETEILDWYEKKYGLEDLKRLQANKRQNWFCEVARQKLVKVINPLIL